MLSCLVFNFFCIISAQRLLKGKLSLEVSEQEALVGLEDLEVKGLDPTSTRTMDLEATPITTAARGAKLSLDQTLTRTMDLEVRPTTSEEVAQVLDWVDSVVKDLAVDPTSTRITSEALQTTMDVRGVKLSLDLELVVLDLVVLELVASVQVDLAVQDLDPTSTRTMDLEAMPITMERNKFKNYKNNCVCYFDE